MADILSLLDPNDEVAAQRRLNLFRRKLVNHFTWRGYADPEELAQEVITRTIRRLDEAGGTLTLEDPERFMWGVARHVRQEAERTRLRAKGEDVIEDHANSLATERDLVSEIFVKEALAQLSAADVELLQDYTFGDSNTRKELAERLGKTVEALRVQVFQIRKRMRDWVQNKDAKRNGESRHNPRDDS